MSADSIQVEVVFAMPDRQVLIELEVPATATVADAIELSLVAGQFPDSELAGLPVGIWGREVERSARLSAGDRVEIYRPLAIDPKEARRTLAAAGRTMADDGRRQGGD